MLTFLARLFAPAPAPTRRAPARLGLEALEGRDVPAVIVWADGSQETRADDERFSGLAVFGSAASDFIQISHETRYEYRTILGQRVLGPVNFIRVNINGTSAEVSASDSAGPVTVYSDGELFYARGDDTVIYTGSRNVTVYTGRGNNHVQTGSGNDTVYAGVTAPWLAPDLVPIGAPAPTNDGNDVINVGGGNDTVYGGVGRDQISGGLGDDTLYGGYQPWASRGYENDGNDLLDGGEGDDELSGGTGDDNLSGGDDNDTLRGGSGNDLLDGGDDRDELSGGEGHDELYGGGDRDKLFGGSGWDWLFGGSGDDELDGGGDSDFGFGGSGVDTHTDIAGDAGIWLWFGGYTSPITGKRAQWAGMQD